MTQTIFDRTIMKPFVALTPRWLRPNFITAVRLILVPFVIWFLIEEKFGAGFVLFLIAAFSDALDGAVARTRGEITKLGKIFDPFADKLLIVSTAFLMISQYLPFWLFIAVLLVELLTISIALYYRFAKKVEAQANVFGKIKMFLQTVSLILLFLFAIFWPINFLIKVAFYALLISVFFAVFSLWYDKRNI